MSGGDSTSLSTQPALETQQVADLERQQGCKREREEHRQATGQQADAGREQQCGDDADDVSNGGS